MICPIALHLKMILMISIRLTLHQSSFDPSSLLLKIKLILKFQEAAGLLKMFFLTDLL